MNLIQIEKRNERIYLASFTERYYIAKNKLPNATNYAYTSTTGTDKFDFTFTYNNVECIAEAKVRTFNSDNFSSLLLERDKYDALIELYEQTGKTPYYVMFYKDAKVVYFNLLNFINAEPIRKLCPATSQGSNKTMVWKWVYELPLTEGETHNYTIPNKQEIETKFYSFYKAV